MLKDVGMTVPNTRETRVVYMPLDKRLWHTTIIAYLHLFKMGIMHGIFTPRLRMRRAGLSNQFCLSVCLSVSQSVSHQKILKSVLCAQYTALKKIESASHSKN